MTSPSAAPSTRRTAATSPSGVACSRSAATPPPTRASWRTRTFSPATRPSARASASCPLSSLRCCLMVSSTYFMYSWYFQSSYFDQPGLTCYASLRYASICQPSHRAHWVSSANFMCSWYYRSSIVDITEKKYKYWYNKNRHIFSLLSLVAISSWQSWEELYDNVSYYSIIRASMTWDCMNYFIQKLP